MSVGLMVRWQRAKARISEGLDAWKALRAERRQLLADKVVKEVEEKEAKWWVDVLKMMERQMQGGVQREAMVIVGSGMLEYWATTDVAVREVSENMRVLTERKNMLCEDMMKRLVEYHILADDEYHILTGERSA